MTDDGLDLKKHSPQFQIYFLASGDPPECLSLQTASCSFLVLLAMDSFFLRSGTLTLWVVGRSANFDMAFGFFRFTVCSLPFCGN